MESSRGRCLVGLLLVAASLCAHVSAAASDTAVLAAERTRRKDPLDGLKYYTGGWNISNRHYLASAGFSAAPVFVIAALWFVAVAAAALVSCCCRCCRGGGNSNYSYSRRVFALSLVLLIVFTASAIIGCAVLYHGQGKLHGSTTATLDYVVSQADGAAATMRDFTGLLETAKSAGGSVASLPPDVARAIDDVARRVDAASGELAVRTASNSRRIRTVLDTIRKVLIGVAAVMLVLVILGFVFSLTGLKSLVYTVVFLGWIIVTATLILSGTFLLLHNVIGDTCVAMDEWVVQPQGRTALDDILPCADAAVTAEALRRSEEVNYQLVSKLNELVSNVSNRNVPPQVGPPLYYNQSGPPVPLLCNPYNADLSDRRCAAGEVTADNAQQVWQRFVCRTTAASGSEVCATVGRLTPAMLSQMLTVASVSDGLRRQAPALRDLANCATVRRAFQTISERGCPPLRRDSSRVYQALLAASVAAMLAAAAWVAHSRERRRRRESERFRVSPYRLPIEDKVLLNSPRRPYRRV
ncbi:hypothetical protein SEVIR_4G209100v4 [Setaria viridis]|uniref:Uncharacterized protein n=1 Tax=Setaria viridis TaxID=4556 RepID=A0A4V6D8I0_SETVI|nr:uncharacterized protein LOC117851415 [Setaria viridis]TKW22136.1 hypothetical protein SEVIR_4G209100v2 [Setaria viridis]